MSDEGFENQGEALEYLVNLYNIEEGRKKTGRETEIDEFRKHFNRIMDMYLASLALCSDAEDRIREGFSVRMENQEQEIKRLREQSAERKEKIDALEKKLEDKQAELDAQEEALAKAKEERDAAISDHDKREAAIRKQLDMIDTQSRELAESRNQIAKLTEVKDSQVDAVHQLKEQVASLTAKLENLDDYKQRLSRAHDELQAASDRVSELSERLADAKAKLEAAAKDKENAVREAKVQAAQKASDKIEQQQVLYSNLMERYEKLGERMRQVGQA
ncbi:hypothetical protein [Selenomonas sp. AB3002]